MPITWPIDLKNTAVLTASVGPSTITSSTNGTGVDCQTTEGPIHALLLAGTVDFTTGDESYAFKVQEATDNSTYTDIPGATFSFAGSATAGNTTEMLGVVSRSKRYVRVVATLGGTTPSFAGTVGILAKKKIAGGSGLQTSVSVS